MESVKRKRVTQVGSGAWSIYLPKKWIDAWTSEQRRDREVDLVPVGANLMVVPVIQDRRHNSKVVPEPARVRRHLLSAYVRGERDVRLEPAVGKFESDCVASARELLRHLDERLTATVGPDAIGFSLRDGPVVDPHAILPAMGAKVAEILGLLREAAETWAHEPDQALHTLQMMQALHDEDLSRLHHQALRQVATMQVPLDAITDVQLLDILASDLLQLGERAQEGAKAILGLYGLATEDLHYPREHLMTRVAQIPQVSPVMRELLATERRALDEARQILSHTLSLLNSGDAARLEALANQARHVQALLEERAVTQVLTLPVSPSDQPVFLAALRLGTRIGNILNGIAKVCSTASTLLCARPAPPVKVAATR